jgi:hypothetical protein
MPCYQINVISVEFSGKSLALLKAAAKDLGWRYSHNGNIVQIGRVKVDLGRGMASGETDYINQVKRAYSRSTVKQVAKRNGWSVSVKGENKIVINKW